MQGMLQVGLLQAPSDFILQIWGEEKRQLPRGEASLSPPCQLQHKFEFLSAIIGASKINEVIRARY